MQVQITMREGGDFLDVVIEPKEFNDIIVKGDLRGYRIAALSFFIGGQRVIYDRKLVEMSQYTGPVWEVI